MPAKDRSGWAWWLTSTSTGCASFTLLLIMLSRSDVAAQAFRISPTVQAGTEAERYLRALELVGLAPAGQWTVRPQGLAAAERLQIASAHPWRSLYADSIGTYVSGVRLTPPSVSLIANSSFPYGDNDGPVWAGKGMTVSAKGGISGRYRRRVVLTLEPVGFYAQNAKFAMAPNGFADQRRFANWSAPTGIDQPQAFGPAAHARIDPGESTLRAQLSGAMVELTTAAAIWGPAYDHPLIVGTNAGGIPRLVAGTDGPRNVGPVRVNGQIFWGVIRESAFAADSAGSGRHFATGILGVVEVKGNAGLEIGAGRFFHVPLSPKGLSDAPFHRAIQAFMRTEAVPDTSFGFNPDNQLASLFLRLAPRAKGFEIYAEYGREDRNADFRDLLLEPDHIAAFTIGFARGWSDSGKTTVTVLRGELMNSRISHLQQRRAQSQWYVHGSSTGGHTTRGQVIGSPGGFGGGASVLSLDRYSAGGRITVRWDRVLRATQLNTDGLPVQGKTDVTHAAGFERSLFTRSGELTVGATLVREFNRYFISDALNANVQIEYRIIR